MLVKRRQERETDTSFRYFIADSSPQGNRNWLLSKSSIIAASDVMPADSLLESVKCDLAEAASKACISLDRIALLRNKLEMLRSKIAEHTNVPVAIGLSHANTAHKSAAFLHSALLEVDPRQFQTMLINALSFTSDLGVEIGVPGFRSTLGELLPPWRQQFLQTLEPEENGIDQHHANSQAAGSAAATAAAVAAHWEKIS